MSGGERQRVAIARAVVGNPPLLLADEPTGNLDSVSGASIVELLHDLNAQGTTIVVITHDNDLAADMPRRVAIRDGRIVSDSGRAAPAGPPFPARPAAVGAQGAPDPTTKEQP